MPENTRFLGANYAYPPRAMRAETAAIYLGYETVEAFLRLVNDGKLPQGFMIGDGVPRWDRHDLERVVDEAKDSRDDSA